MKSPHISQRNKISRSRQCCSTEIRFTTSGTLTTTFSRAWRGFPAFPVAHANGLRHDFHGFWPVPLDVVADGDDFVVRASMPGMAPENIQVFVEGNVLTIKGETASHFQHSDGSYLMRERRAGSFHRALRLPDWVAHDNLEPRYEHGVLTVTRPKAEAKRAKQFEVKVVEGPAEVAGS